jgi:hypothetical protein
MVYFMVTIKHVNVGSAFRVGLMVSAVVAALTGLLFIALQGLFMNLIFNLLTIDPSTGSFTSSSGSSVFATFSLVTMCIFYVMMVVFSAIFGGISAAVSAFAYNLVSRWVGGLEIELETQGKSKRGSADDIFE